MFEVVYSHVFISFDALGASAFRRLLGDVYVCTLCDIGLVTLNCITFLSWGRHGTGCNP